MEDIAALAHVSKSAVSLAFSGKPGISEETRARIIQIAQENGYAPRARKSSLPQPELAPNPTLRFIACTNSGIVLEQFNKQPFFMELIQCIEEQCRLRGYSLLYSSVPAEQLEEKLDQFAAEHEVSGMILLGTNLTREQIELIASRERNLVVLDTCVDTLNANFIVMNNQMGAYQACKHLIELGHTRIGYIESSHRMYNFDARRKGFLLALAEHELGLRKEDIFTTLPTVITPQDDFKHIIEQRRDDLPTAFFCECDYIAISAMKSLMELGIRVPGDISIVGFDNINESMVISPELTTVHVEKEKIAELAVTMMKHLMSSESSISVKTTVDTRLIVRRSTAAAAVRENLKKDSLR
ncbi:LacI family DNA-binding transcriptional regulator [Paenibacillus sp. SYP-B4298]|uniref:LacI family DNA-binding transcriptional regulator n=1 Tax=Paenibacillus sp. SYP-B4298 TaxID=2996034 RepID=UPI002FD7CB41